RPERPAACRFGRMEHLFGGNPSRHKSTSTRTGGLGHVRFYPFAFCFTTTPAKVGKSIRRAHVLPRNPVLNRSGWVPAPISAARLARPGNAADPGWPRRPLAGFHP